jgi:O-acetyl-ADP-ribose deacetylase (regulator of RNase III)
MFFFAVIWEQVWLSWPDEHLFRSLFGFDAANGAVALARLHAAIKSAELPTGATVDLGAGLNPANYAAVRGASALVEAGAKAVRAAVEAFVREHVVVEPVRGLAPAEEAFLAAPPRALAAGIEATHSVVVDFNGDGDCTLAKGTQVEVFGVVSKPELNGRRGEVVSFGVSKDRLHVQLSAAPGHPREKPLALRASALRILSGPGGSSGRTPRVLLEATGEGTGAKVRVLHGDLLFSGCCAIINAANGRLAHGGGVASAIAFAAGPACESECRQLVGAAKGGRLPTGAAVPTSAGAVLGARGTKVVVHAVVPEWDLREGGDASVLLMQQAVRAALAEAEKAGARSVAIPLCGSGIFGWPASRAAEAVVGALVAYAANPATKLQCLDLVDFDAPKAAASAAALSDLCGAAPKAADATSAVPLPNNQWFFYCKELSKRKDGFQPYDYDQNQQIEAAWAAFVDNSILNEVTIIGDAGGVRSNSTNFPEGKTAAEYLICFKPRIEDCRQKNVVSVFERQLKREKCIEPPPLFEARVAEAAQVGGGSGGSVRSGGGLFRITRDGRGSSGGGGCGAVAARASVAVRGFAENAQAGARALIEAVRASKREKELRVDDAETPSQDLLVDLQAAAADFCATVELAPDGKRAVVRAFGDALLAAAFGVCVDVREQAREAARAPPAGWDLAVRTAAGTSFVLTAVPQGSAEWCRVADAIAVTLPAAKLTRLERVQNKAKWDEYAQRRAEVTKSSPDGFDANEVMCFHGTRGFPVVKVCEAGLDFRHGNAGCMWGIALYIAANASYSDAYSSDGNNGERQFFYVRAALGRPSEMLPNASTRAPPPGFDSVRGTTGGSRVHMLYDLGQAYPEYLVTYRRG